MKYSSGLTVRLVPIRPRSRCERRFLRTLSVFTSISPSTPLTTDRDTFPIDRDTEVRRARRDRRLRRGEVLRREVRFHHTGPHTTASAR